MPSSICWPLGEKSQLKVEGMCSLLKVSASFSRANSPRRLTQAPRLVETVTSGEVVTMRSAISLLSRPSSLSSAPKPCCVDITGCSGTTSCAGAAMPGGMWRRGPLANGTPSRKRCSSSGSMLSPSNAIPFVSRAHLHGGAEALHLRRRHQAGMIVLMAGKGQTKTLDGVGDEADRPIVVDVGEGVDQRRQVMPGEIGHESRQLLIGARLDQPRDRALIADLIE